MITLITGGARSGKSAYAVGRVASEQDVGFIATAQPLDEEMRVRIERHKRDRPAGWTTYEEPLRPASVVLAAKHRAFVLDCLTLLVSNLLLEGKSEDEILSSMRDLIQAVRQNGADFFIVTNETGLGVVPDNDLARRYRDLLGSANRMFADASDSLIFMVCGKPLSVPL